MLTGVDRLPERPAARKYEAYRHRVIYIRIEIIFADKTKYNYPTV